MTCYALMQNGEARAALLAKTCAAAQPPSLPRGAGVGVQGDGGAVVAQVVPGSLWLRCMQAQLAELDEGCSWEVLFLVQAAAKARHCQPPNLPAPHAQRTVSPPPHVPPRPAPPRSRR